MIEYKRLTKDDLDEMFYFYETYLNEGEFMRDQLREEIEDESFVGYKAVEDGKTVGICFGKDKLELTYPHPRLEQKIMKAKGNLKLHCVDAMVVDKDYRYMGVSTGMLKAYKEEIADKGYDLIFGEIWIYPDGNMPVNKPMMTFGKPYWESVEKMYYRNLSKYGLTCPVCGKKCICGAKLTLYNFEREEAKE